MHSSVVGHISTNCYDVFNDKLIETRLRCVHECKTFVNMLIKYTNIIKEAFFSLPLKLCERFTGHF